MKNNERSAGRRGNANWDACPYGIHGAASYQRNAKRQSQIFGMSTE
jgi:hypothetical protein